MNEWVNVRTWEKALTMLDDYAGARKGELGQKQLSKGMGLIKSYMIEAQVTA